MTAKIIQDFAPSMRSRRHIIGKEILANLAAAVLWPFGSGGNRRSTKRQHDQRTLVLIHGYASNRSIFLPLYLYLRTIGIKSILTFNYRSSQSIEQSAIELKAFLQNKVRGGRIDLIGHSLGGIVARIYLQQLGGARRVDRCIALGTPHAGTYSAYWLPTRLGEDLKPDSPLLERIHRYRAAAERVKFTSIVGGSDNIVVPRVFAKHGEDVVHIPDLGHAGLLFSLQVFQVIAQRLLPNQYPKCSSVARITTRAVANDF